MYIFVRTLRVDFSQYDIALCILDDGKPYLLVMGGISDRWNKEEYVNKSDFVSRAVDVVDLLGNQPTQLPVLPELPEPRMGACVAVYQNDFFIIGGASMVISLSFPNAHRTLWRYESQTRTWQIKSPMHEDRKYFSTVLIGTKLFAIGGYNESFILATVESMI